MEFFNSAVDTLQTIVVGLGGALCVWGGINLLEGYGQDNPGSKSQGVKQLVAGGGVALIGVTLPLCGWQDTSSRDRTLRDHLCACGGAQPGYADWLWGAGVAAI